MYQRRKTDGCNRLLGVEGPLHGTPMFAVVAGVARNREPEACKRTVGHMVAVVCIVLRIILNVFFKIYLLSFVFVFIKLGKVSLEFVHKGIFSLLVF